MRKVLERCPTCKDELIVTRLECPTCHTKIEGEYQLCRFCKLSQENLKFIEIFVKNRGNIKEMERELGVSYPTVRNQLMDVVKELGYQTAVKPDEQELTDKRMAILEELEQGTISADEAAEEIIKSDLQPNKEEK